MLHHYNGAVKFLSLKVKKMLRHCFGFLGAISSREHGGLGLELVLKRKQCRSCAVIEVLDSFELSVVDGLLARTLFFFVFSWGGDIFVSSYLDVM